MTRTIVIDLAGEEDILVTKSKQATGAPRTKEEWMAPEPRLAELTYEELHDTMPAAYRALFEEYFRK